jgi:RNA polymerase sigma factor for flagellar operon FliA
MNNLLEQYHATKDPLIKQQIILEYQNLIWYIINKNRIRPIGILTLDDYFSFGVEGLNDAIERYEPKYNVKFETWASIKIEGAIKDASKAYLPDRKKKNPDINVKPRKGDYDSEYEHSSTLIEDFTPDNKPTPDFIEQQNELNSCLLDAIKTLPERTQIAMKLYFFDTLTQLEIANLLGKSQRLVSHIIRQGLRRLRKDKRLRELFNVGETENNRG